MTPSHQPQDPARHTHTTNTHDTTQVPTTTESPYEYLWTEQFYQELDPEIEPIVRLLNQHGVLTLESCQGGPGHSYGYPTVLFDGERDTARQVRKLAREHGLRPIRLHLKKILFYPIKPFWKLTLHHPEHRKLTINQRIWCMLKFAIGL